MFYSQMATTLQQLFFPFRNLMMSIVDDGLINPIIRISENKCDTIPLNMRE